MHRCPVCIEQTLPEVIVKEVKMDSGAVYADVPQVSERTAPLYAPFFGLAASSAPRRPSSSA